MNGEDRSSHEGCAETHPVLRLTLGLVLSVSSAAFWGWASESLLVAGLTLVCAGSRAVLGCRRARSALAEAALLAGIGAVWAGVDRIWERLGIGSWARL